MTSPLGDKSELKEAGCAAFERGDYDKAFANLNPILPTDDVGILNALGWMLENGQGCKRDTDRATDLFRQSADHGSNYGLLVLGDVLADSGNLEEARAFYEKGASQGFAPAMARLGRMLVTEDAQPETRGRGISLLEAAAAKGNIYARRILLGCDLKEAKSIFKKAGICVQILMLAASGIPILLRSPDSDEVM